MKINLEVIHSCTIKRKKPWPKLNWIGKNKEQLFLLDHQRLSIIDPKTGKTRRKVSCKLNPSILKTVVAYNTSQDRQYLIGILNTGDLLIWNKDTDQCRHIGGRPDFAFVSSSSHYPNVFISDCASKVILITSCNKVFVWESEEPPPLRCRNHQQSQQQCINGNWSDIVASKDIRTVELSKELVLDARFSSNSVEGTTATCCFAFNYENRPILNVLKIKWLELSENQETGDHDSEQQQSCQFTTLWICYEPNLFQDNIELVKQNNGCLHTRGAYVLQLSHSTTLMALASNQKHVINTCLVFISPINGFSTKVNLRNFGLKPQAKGRHYWIQSLIWLHNDLYLAGITKHGALFLCSRLGEPLLIYALGQDVDMGPAFYLTLHPLIIVKNKGLNDQSLNQDTSSISSSTVDNNQWSQRQHYSIANHPHFPVLLCSDGFLLCVLQLQTAFATQPRLMRELLHESMGLLDSIQNERIEVGGALEKKKKQSEELKSSEKPLPNWSLEEGSEEEESDDSGVDEQIMNKNKKYLVKDQKIAQGKIIFSYLQEMQAVSTETQLTTDCLARGRRLRVALEILECCWSLLVSTNVIYDIGSELEQQAVSIQQAFEQLISILLDEKCLTTEDLCQITEENDQDEKKQKLKMIDTMVLNLLRTLQFDMNAHNAAQSHLIEHLSSFMKTILKLLLMRNWNSSSEEEFQSLSFSYSLLLKVEFILKNTYNQLKLTSLNSDPILSQQSSFRKQQNSTQILVSAETPQEITFINSMLEHCWLLLLHYAMNNNYENKNLNLLSILIQRRCQQFSSLQIQLMNNKKNSLLAESMDYGSSSLKTAEIAYLSSRTLQQSVLNIWLDELKRTLHSLKSHEHTFQDESVWWQRHQSLNRRGIRIVHQLFYAHLEHSKLESFLYKLNLLLNECSSYSLFKCIYWRLHPPNEPMPRLPEPLLVVLKSLGRFMANYLTIKQNGIKSVYIYSISNPKPLPSLLLVDKHRDRVQLSTESIVFQLQGSRAHTLSQFLTADKTLELLLCTGLFDEAIHFTALINEWKCSLMLSSMFQSSLLSPTSNTNKLLHYFKIQSSFSSLFQSNNSKIMDGPERESLQQILRELLFCDVIVNQKKQRNRNETNDENEESENVSLFEQLMHQLLDQMTKILIQMDFYVPQEFYLPAPPIYCAQMSDTASSTESRLRFCLAHLVQCVVCLIEAACLPCPLCKWYLERLLEARMDMQQTYALNTRFQINEQLRILLGQIRYQKLGYLNETILDQFRQFCALLFYFQVRDKFSLCLRKFKQKEKIDNDLCTELIEQGCLLLNYSCFMMNNSEQKELDLKDILLSVMLQMTREQVALATGSAQLFQQMGEQLAFLIEKKVKKNKEEEEDTLEQLKNSFQKKYEKLLNIWSEISVVQNQTNAETISLRDLFMDHTLLIRKNTNAKLNAFYGLGEQDLLLDLEKRSRRGILCETGAYAFERSEQCSDFLEMFIRLTFDQTEDWQRMQSDVNGQYPLLPEFYECIRDQDPLLGAQHVDQQLIVKRKKKKKEMKKKTILMKKRRNQQRSLSLEIINLEMKEKKIKSSESFSNLNGDYEIQQVEVEETESDTEMEMKLGRHYSLNVLDYGDQYLQCTNLAIWLIKWSDKFQQILVKSKMINNHSKSMSNSSILKLNSVNVNMLVAAVYLTNGNSLESSSDFNKYLYMKAEEEEQKINEPGQEEKEEPADLTQISSSWQLTDRKQHSPRKSIVKHEDKEEEEEEETHVSPKSPTSSTTTASSTLDISSLSEIPNVNHKQQGIQRNRSPKRIQNRSPPPPPTPPKAREENFEKKISSVISPISEVSQLTNVTINNNKTPTPRVQSPQNRSINNSSLIFHNNNNKLMENSNNGFIQDVIRNELKKIVQLQHDTVMNFLNNGTTTTPTQQLPPLENSLDQQLTSILKQQQSNIQGGGPIEFIIETKIKTKNEQQIGGGKIPTSTRSFEFTQQSQEEKSYFLKTFDSKMSSVKIPLLNLKSLASTSLMTVENKLPLIESRQKQSQPTNDDRRFNSSKFPFLINFKETSSYINVNKHIKHLMVKLNESKLKSSKVGIPLLQLNQEQKNHLKRIKTEKNKNKKKSTEEEEEEEEEKVTRRKKRSQKSTQKTKPLYDGYILAPEVFKDLLETDEAKNNKETSSYAHYKATEHLRQETVVEVKANQKTTSTMTEEEVIGSADPLMPNILFQLKFEEKENLKNEKDFLNVVDLDQKAVAKLLKEVEENKQSQEMVNLHSIEIKNEQKMTTPRPTVIEADLLTRNILIKQKSEESLISQEKLDLDYNKMIAEIKQRYEKENKKKHQEPESAPSSMWSKQKSETVLFTPLEHPKSEYNDLLRIDVKIKAITEEIMDQDYSQYSSRINKIKMMTIEQEKEEEEVNIIDIKEEEQIKKRVQIGEEIYLNKIINNEDEDLSELKSDEEERVRQMLNLTKTRSSRKPAKTVTMHQDLDLKLDENLENSSSSSPSSYRASSCSPKRRQQSALNKLKTTKISPQIIRKATTKQDIKKKTPKRIPMSSTSPNIRKDKEMAKKRELQLAAMVVCREKQAKKLMKKMLIEEQDLRCSLSTSGSSRSRSRGRSRSRSKSRDRYGKLCDHSRSRSPPPSPHKISASPRPETKLNKKEKEKPSLMFQTILSLQHKEQLKQSETESLLHQLEQRAKQMQSQTPRVASASPKRTIPSFTEKVRLQQPHKLRTHIDQEPVTYVQQLLKYQDNTVTVSQQQKKKQNPEELQKIFGTKRLFKSPNVNGRRMVVKTYAQRLKELRPKESQVRPRPPFAPAINKTKPVQQKQIKKPLITKKRFTPYQTPITDSMAELEGLDDLAQWHLDENMRNILYGKVLQKPKKMTQTVVKQQTRISFKKRDVDEETLADVDGDYMLHDLLEEEKKNEKVYENILKELKTIEKMNPCCKDGGEEDSTKIQESEINLEQLDQILNQCECGCGGNGAEHYLSQISIEDLNNFSMSSEQSAAFSSFIDWDQVDQLIENLI